MEVRFYLPLKPRAPIRATLSTPPPSRLNSPSLSPVSVLLRFAIHRTLLLLLLLSSSLPPRALSILSLFLSSTIPLPSPSPSLFNSLSFCSTFSPPSPALSPRSPSFFPLFFLSFLSFPCSSPYSCVLSLFEFPMLRY